jgi:hypothetical protein
MIVSLPVTFGDKIRTRHEVSMWEQLSNAAALQEVWADNQVSATITFDPKTEGKDIARALDHFQYRLKGVSFLPLLEEGAYPQMPEQKISREEFMRISAKLKPLQFNHVDGYEADNTAADKYCDGGKCAIPSK